MKTSLLLLTALSVALLLQASLHSHASELSQLLDEEIRDLKDEIEKRGRKRKPCGFTWFCGRRRSRRSHGKRVREISICPYQTHKWQEVRHLCHAIKIQPIRIQEYLWIFDGIKSTLPVMRRAYVALIVLARLHFPWHGFSVIPWNIPFVTRISLAYSKFK